MYLAVVWSFLLGISLLAAFPGEGPGIQDHPDGYSGVVRDRLKHHLSYAKRKYLWSVNADYSGETSNALDWSLDLMFHEETRDEQGLNYQTETELRQQHLSKVGELLTIVVMCAACLTVIRLMIKKRFPSESERRTQQIAEKQSVTRRQSNSRLRSVREQRQSS